MSLNLSKGKKIIVLTILSMIAGLVYLTPFLRFTFYDQMTNALNLTDVQLGSIGGIYGLFNVLGYLPSGYLSERFNTKLLLIVSTLGMALTTLWYSSFPGFASLMVIHALYGVFSVWTFWSPYLKALRNLGPQKEQGRIFGMSDGLRGLASAAVSFICLAVMSKFFAESVGAGFRAMLFINMGVFILLMLAVVALVPSFDAKDSSGAGNENQPAKPAIGRLIADTLKSPSTWLCIFVIMCGYCLWNTMNGFIGTYCVRVLGLSEDMSSTLAIFRSFLIAVVAGFTGGFIIDKFSTKGKGMFCAFASVGLCLLAIFCTSKFMVVCVALTLLLGYFINVVKGTYWSIMGEAGVPLASTGMAAGVISLIGLTPDIFVPPIVSLFLSYGEEVKGSIEFGFNLMLIWMMAWAALGVLASLILKRYTEKHGLAGKKA